MKFSIARGILLLEAFVFIWIGLFFVVAPGTMLGYVEVEARTAVARTDIRAVYGGLDLGIGVLLLVGATQPAFLVYGLWTGSVVFGSLVVTRLLGLILDGSQAAITYYLLAFEIVGFLASGLALMLVSQRRRIDFEA